MSKNIYIQIIIRILLLIVNSIAIYYFLTQQYTITFFIFCLLLIGQIFLFIDYIKLLFADIEKSIDCLLYDDYSISISKEKRKSTLYNKTALLIEKHKKRNFQQTSEQLIFTNIIESLAIGILILRKDIEGNIEVFQINNTFTDFLKIPKYYKWELLKEKIKPVMDLIDAEHWKKQRNTISLNVNDQTETFYLKTSVTKTYNFEYLVITLETIQQIIDKKEKESWYKLMNVMSHEIINTITPISTLANNLNSLLQEEPDKETLNELSQGLQIINRRSLHLTNFVNTYRTLTELPLPEKEQININQLIKNTLTLFKQEFEEKSVTIIFDNSENHILNIDKKQIEQVFINLISNSLNAIKNKLSISIQIELLNNKVNIYFSDNGIGIPDDIKDNIFIPYFTTRKDGSGIGLTLTKSIIESHGGTIYYKPEKEKTMFVLSFML